MKADWPAACTPFKARQLRLVAVSNWQHVGGVFVSVQGDTAYRTA